MLEKITGAVIYAEVCLQRTQHSGGFLLIEGTSEYQLFSVHAHPDLQVICCHGCVNLDDAKARSKQRSDRDVAAIRDRDWFSVLHAEPTDTSLFLTEMYDLDATIILTTDVGRRVTEVQADSESLNNWLADHPDQSSISLAVCFAAAVGTTRLASERHKLGIRTESTPFGNDISETDQCTINIKGLLKIILARTEKPSVTHDELIQYFETEHAKGISKDRLCCGHDLLRALSHLIAGPWNGEKIGQKALMKSMHGALSAEEFRNLQSVANVEQWAFEQGFSAWK